MVFQEINLLWEDYFCIQSFCVIHVQNDAQFISLSDAPLFSEDF